MSHTEVPSMNMFQRWLAAVAACFLLFPVAFAVVKGPDEHAGFLGGIMWMMFIQFISPFRLWMIPLCVGTAIAVAWHFIAKARTSGPPS